MIDGMRDGVIVGAVVLILAMGLIAAFIGME